MRNDGLRSVQHPSRAVTLGSGYDIGQVVARLAFAVREGQLQAALGDRRQDGLLLVRRTRNVQCGSAQHDGGEKRFQHQRSAERLHHQHDFLGAAAEAAVVLGERQTKQAEFGELRPNGGGKSFGQGQCRPLALSETVRVAQHAADAFDQ